MKGLLNAKFIEVSHKEHNLNCFTNLKLDDGVKTAGLVSVLKTLRHYSESSVLHDLGH